MSWGLPLDDAALLEAADSVAAGARPNRTAWSSGRAKTRWCGRRWPGGPFALVVLGGEHDLTESARRVAGADCEYVPVTVGGYPE